MLPPYLSLPLLLLLLALNSPAQATFTLSFPNGTVCSDPYTLTDAVTYTMNITFPVNDIPANSKVAVQFGYRYSITASTLTGCQYSTVGGSYSAGSCSVQSFGSSTSTTYVITFDGIYPTTATSQSTLNLKVHLGRHSLQLRILGAVGLEQPKTSSSSLTMPPAIR